MSRNVTQNTKTAVIKSSRQPCMAQCLGFSGCWGGGKGRARSGFNRSGTGEHHTKARNATSIRSQQHRT